MVFGAVPFETSTTVTDGEPRLIPRFEEVARRHAGRLAIGTHRGDFTYAELNAAANRFAHAILSRSAERGDRVAVLMSPGPELHATMLGVLKAARIAVILNHADPLEQLGQLAGESEPAVIVTDAAHHSTATAIAGAAAVVTVGEEQAEPQGNPDLDISPEEIAFLVYTSGSTGRPKAIMKSHGHMLHQYISAGRAQGIVGGDRYLLLVSLSGGQGINTTWVAFSSGASLVTFPTPENGVTGLDRYLRDRAITAFIAPASLFRTFVRAIDDEAQFPLVRVATLAGEAATWDDFRAFHRHFPNGSLVSGFAASETGYITLTKIPADHPPGTGALPVGKPCKGQRLRVVDDHGRECPPGVVGRIEVSGPHLASGYWRNPELTADRFRDGPGGGRTFRSDDLGYVDASGGLMLRGRADATVKIRGHRVDLSEVEESLANLPGVAAAAAVALPTPGGAVRLVAYIVAADRRPMSERETRTFARATMARHLIPSSFVFLESLPLSPNGKVDQARLRAMGVAAGTRAPCAPTTETERSLVGIWQDAFETDSIGRSDNFFDLGGDSLVAAEICARIHATHGVELNVCAISETPSLTEMAGEIDRKRAAESRPPEAPIVRVPRDGGVPLSYHQQAVWAACRTARQSRRFNLASLIRLNGHLQVDAFHRAIAYVVERHESLRTRFAEVDGAAVQVIEPPKPVELPLIDLTDEPDPEEDVRRLLGQERRQTFDLHAAPPILFKLIRLAPDRHALLRSGHHIISDAPSWNIFVRDLGEAYQAIVNGRDPALPPLPFQYADYSVWHRQALGRNTPGYREAVAWWGKQLLDAADWRNRMWLRRFIRERPVAAPAAGEDGLTWGLDPATSSRLDGLALSEAATYYVVRLAIMTPMVAALTGSDGVVIGGIFTTRHRLEFEGVFGLFSQRLPLILSCDWDASLRQLVRYVRRRIAEVQAHADIPFDLLQSALAEKGIEIPAIHYRIHMPTQSPPLRLGGLELRHDQPGWRSHGGIMFRFDQLREQSGGCATLFDARIYDPSRMPALVDAFVRFAAAVAREPDAPIRAAVAASGLDAYAPDPS